MQPNPMAGTRRPWLPSATSFMTRLSPVGCLLLAAEEHFEVGKWSERDELEVDQLFANERQLVERLLGLVGAVALEDEYNTQRTIRAAIHFANHAFFVQLPV